MDAAARALTPLSIIRKISKGELAATIKIASTL